ncbi:MAG: circadian clock KaiB family protein [Planctomycetota bacterium]
MHKFRLYVIGKQPRSVNAAENLRKLFDDYLKMNYILDVVDLLQRPDMGRQDHILATPTLVKLSPKPIRRVVGDFQDTRNLRRLLDLIGGGENNESPTLACC